MTTIAIDISAVNPASMTKALRALAEWSGVATSDRENLRYLADAIDDATSESAVPRYYIYPDADDEPTIWRSDDPVANPHAIARRSDNPELWDLAIKGQHPDRTRPPEPHGFGAVVLAADGNQYVRTADSTIGGAVWIRLGYLRKKDAVSWSELETPIEVLSEGVS